MPTRSVRIEPVISSTVRTLVEMIEPYEGRIYENIFHDLSNNLSNQIFNNQLQNEKLTQLRDTLLPKLMSGEIRVTIEEDDIKQKI